MFLLNFKMTYDYKLHKISSDTLSEDLNLNFHLMKNGDEALMMNSYTVR